MVFTRTWQLLLVGSHGRHARGSDDTEEASRRKKSADDGSHDAGQKREAVYYNKASKPKKEMAALNADHSHFVLVSAHMQRE
jgi:hypothetical protein